MTTCSCGTAAVKKQFDSFSYFYCTTCKIEVGGKGQKPSIWTNTKAVPTDGAVSASIIQDAASAATPPPFSLGPCSLQYPGIVALKGEQVTCSVCGYYCFNLPSDLTDRGPWGRVWDNDLFDEVNAVSRSLRCPGCHVGDSYVQSVGGLIHVKGRGWV